MASTPRIPRAKITDPTIGAVPDGAAVMWQHRPVLMAFMELGRKVEEWDELDASLKAFAHMAVAAKIGCSFCLDFAYFRAHNEGLDETKASEVPRWRESTVFTPLEREVMAYAEAMTDTPPQVTDEMSSRLLDQLGAPAVVELGAVVGFANLTARGNVALGVESQGFSKVCALPLARPSAVHATTT